MQHELFYNFYTKIIIIHQHSATICTDFIFPLPPN